MSNYVWLCQYDKESVVPVFTFYASYPNIYDAVEDFRLENKQKNEGLIDKEKSQQTQMSDDYVALAKNQRMGGYIPKENMPTQLYLMPDSETPTFNEAFFRIATGMFVVNQKCYDIMVQSKLGKTHFSQVSFYDIQTQAKLTDVPYYFINLAESHQFFDNQNSLGVSKNRYMPNSPIRWIRNTKNDDIIVSKEALTVDVDMWFDPFLYNSVFLSDNLVQTLFKAGFTQKELGLVRCQVK